MFFASWLRRFCRTGVWRDAHAGACHARMLRYSLCHYGPGAYECVGTYAEATDDDAPCAQHDLIADLGHTGRNRLEMIPGYRHVVVDGTELADLGTESNHNILWVWKAKAAADLC